MRSDSLDGLLVSTETDELRRAGSRDKLLVRDAKLESSTSTATSVNASASASHAPSAEPPSESGAAADDELGDDDDSPLARQPTKVKGLETNKAAMRVCERVGGGGGCVGARGSNVSDPHLCPSRR